MNAVKSYIFLTFLRLSPCVLKECVPMPGKSVIADRYESFGGILHTQKPPMLVWVDRDYMRSLGYADSPLWDEADSLISAPVEVHAMLSRRCSAGCRGCYADAVSDSGQKELDLEGWKKAMDILAEARVFHVALGGGESMELPWLFELAAYARARGVVPNLTTNGFLVDEHNARSCRVFGQINVSIDGLKEQYRQCRGIDGFERADRALTLLKKARCRFGINTVVSRLNFDRLEEIVRYARAKGVNQIELLRFKPSGRGQTVFDEMGLTGEQLRSFYPMTQKLRKKYGLNLRVDCSFMPQIFFHKPNPQRASFFRVAGCHAGQLLMGIMPDGRVSACSFAGAEDWNINEFPSRWASKDSFSLFRGWRDRAQEPCRTCNYLDLCLGGCHVVAETVCGSPDSGDPGCPYIMQNEERRNCCSCV